MAHRKNTKSIDRFWPDLHDITMTIEKNKERDWLLNFIEEIQKDLIEKTLTREKIAKIVYRRGCDLYQRYPEKAVTACRIISFALWSAPEESEYLVLSLKKRFEILLALKLYSQALSDYEQIILKDKNVDEHIRKQVLKYQRQPMLKAQQARLRLFEQLNFIPKRGLLNITFHILEVCSIPQHIEILRSGLMRTSKAILEGEEIFREAPFAFYPMEANLNEICNNCATSQFIPISCFKCAGNVVYCSTQCKNQHYKVHQYECAFFQNGLITQFRRCDLLAFRMVITGLPTIVHMLATDKNLKEVWTLLSRELMRPSNDITYLNVLKLLTYGDKDKKVIQCDVKNSARLALYLKHKTDFFEIFQKREMVGGWEAFIVSLVFLHLQQIPGNTRALSTIWNTNLLLTPNMPAFIDGRIQPGYLHKFNEIRHTAIAIFPGLSSCKPKCDRMFTIQQIGSSLSICATRDILEGEEIGEYVESANYSLWPRMQRIFGNFCECMFCKSSSKKMFDIVVFL